MDQIELRCPADTWSAPIARLFAVSTARALGAGFENEDDLRLAISEVVNAAATLPASRVSIEVAADEEHGIRFDVHPLPASAVDADGVDCIDVIRSLFETRVTDDGLRFHVPVDEST